MHWTSTGTDVWSVDPGGGNGLTWAARLGSEDLVRWEQTDVKEGSVSSWGSVRIVLFCYVLLMYGKET